MRSHSFLHVVAVTFMMAALTLGSQQPSVGGTHRFTGNITGEFVSTATADPTIFRSTARATGSSSPIGDFSKITDDVFNSRTGEITGTFEMTFVEGAIVRGRYSGHVVPDSTSSFHWQLDAVITGGTGKFRAASGNFVFRARGTHEFYDGGIRGKYTETFDGTIMY